MNVSLPELLHQGLSKPHPYRQVRRAFESDLSYGRYNGPAPPSAVPASVILLLYPGVDQWHLPLTLRPAELRPHGGQISLPGGVVERNENSAEAALRELEEELGVAPSLVQMLGQLSDLYVFASNYLVTPWVAVTRSAPQWIPEAAEVAEVLEIPLGHLVEPSNTRVALREKHGVAFRSPYIAFDDHEIWGATSMILSEFIAVLGDVGVGD